MARIALDASVLIAVLDPADVQHAGARAALNEHADDDLRAPAHTLAEALVHPARLGKERNARRLIAALEVAIDPIDQAVGISAARLRAEHGNASPMPDALVLAYAEVRKARRVLTADARWKAWSHSAEVIGALVHDRVPTRASQGSNVVPLGPLERGGNHVPPRALPLARAETRARCPVGFPGKRQRPCSRTASRQEPRGTRNKPQVPRCGNPERERRLQTATRRTNAGNR
jgi:predicted nucleic acid-binding protein